MSRSKSFAKEEVMQEYLDDLLVDTADPLAATERVAKLLEKATVVEQAVDVPVQKSPVEPAPPLREPQVSPAIEKHRSLDEIKDAVAEAETELSDATGSQPQSLLADRVSGRFQALFFEVAGLTMAVPLIDLGGIHQIDKIGPLFGKPDWFMGVMLHRDEKINVVNSAKWVMPEKYTQKLEEKLHYQYIIMLADSPWGFASDKLINTVELNKSDVKWRQSDGKRPWLAGMVKERMCALIDVYQLTSLLNAGLNSNQK
ncbi:chemotaxis protein CheW [Alteromonas oceanisediminis]|uniref:chemotaxis protein CheW n=1 Tax=Alteromonas oceanisediminis TaxID=2836180 RepID=UPI001BDACAA3|nr:chemotaxis protein CheW [Alteromonas oceanisediminis]MBT0584897.1 chemotaxis protein CheW [Alteromonas oceanisediminis]